MPKHCYIFVQTNNLAILNLLKFSENFWLLIFKGVDWACKSTISKSISFCPTCMSKSSQKVELTVNILIIVVAVLFGAVLIQKYFLSSSSSNLPEHVQPTVGKQMNLSDVNWAGQPKTLILALQNNCHFCDESAPFYRRLLEETKGKNIKLVAVFPTEVE